MYDNFIFQRQGLLLELYISKKQLLNISLKKEKKILKRSPEQPSKERRQTGSDELASV